MDRTGDIVELLVEHATDVRMCDLIDDNTQLVALSSTGSGSGNQSGRRKSGDGSVGLGLIPGELYFYQCFIYVCIINNV